MKYKIFLFTKKNLSFFLVNLHIYIFKYLNMQNICDKELITCSICLNDIKDQDGIKKFKCDHIYHLECINSWNGNCPMCRAEYILKSNQISQNFINGYKRISSVPEQFHSLYLSSWNKKQCIDNSHKLIFVKPYGVIGICENCHIIQSFNLRHNL